MKNFIFYLILNCCNILAQDENKILSVKNMYEDLDFYFSTLQEVHPNPFIALNKEEFQFKIDSIKKQITTPLSKKEFYLHITSLNKYTDLHTRVVGSKKMLKQRKIYYDLPVISIDDDSVFFFNNNSQKLRLIKVNNIKIKNITDYFLSRRNLVETNEQYNFRDMLVLYINDHFINTELVFDCLTADNKNIKLKFPALTTQKNNKRERFYNLECDSTKSIAVLELNSFMPKKTFQTFKYATLLYKIFDTLKNKNIKRLYIDVTCNGGGIVALEEYLLSFLLTDNQIKVSWDLTIKQSPQRKKQRGPFPPIQNGDYYQKRQYLYPQKMKNKFYGEVYIIQSRSSFSAASTFASHLQTYNRAKVIGEECQIKAVYTDPIIIKLKHSKFLFSCSSGYIKNVGCQKNKGVIPDIPYKIYNPYDIISVKTAEKMRLSNNK